jgi:hypothetical protein
MRKLVLISALLLGTGSVLMVIPPLLAFLQNSVFLLTISYVGLALLLSSPVVMLILLILSLLPGSHDRFESCNH